MYKSCEKVQKFEELLKRPNKEQFCKIYNNNKSQDAVFSSRKLGYSQKDVIKNISEQIKAIQNADCLCKSKHTNKLLLKQANAHFMPVNMLEMQYEMLEIRRDDHSSWSRDDQSSRMQLLKVPQKKQNKFETQFELDTQLINIIDDVETVATYKGITQEFDMPFDTRQEDNNNRLNSPIEKVINVMSPEEKDNADKLNAPDDNNDYPYKSTECSDVGEQNKIRSNENNSLEKLQVKEVYSEANAVENISKEIKSNNTLLDTNYPELLVKCMEIEENLNLQNFVNNEDDDISPSPIININKLAHRSVNSSPLLVCNLDSFEKFADIAIPIVEETADLKKAKHLIHSQIIGKELFIQTHLESELNEVQEQLSPVLSINKNKVLGTITCKSSLNLDKKAKESFKWETELTKCQVDNTPNNAKEKSKIPNSLQDENLFSSDEETVESPELQDLPFTCALDTSFYDQPNVLDRTMYVGFQTASNRSIQISTVSFTKAKSILDELDNKINSVPVTTLKDLVEKCDNSFKDSNTSDKICDKTNTADDKTKPNTSNVLENENVNVTSEFVGLKFSKDSIDKNLEQEQTQFQENTSNSETNDKFKKPLVAKRKLEGFKTASNKRIKLSDLALARCKKVFQDIDLSDSFSDDNDAQNNSNDKKLINTFKNEDSIEKEKDLLDYLNLTKMDDNILQEFEGEMYFEENDRKKDNSSGDIVGFKTASNKDIKISDNALAKTKQIFDGIDILKLTSYSSERDDRKKDNSSGDIVGFKTASNKDIKISDTALAKTKQIFDGIDILKLTSYSSERDDRKKDNSSGDIVGFKTASNKDIKISDNALAKTKQIFDGIDILKLTSNSSERDDRKKDNSSGDIVCFKTASNKDIKISDNALAKTKQIFDGLDIFKITSKSSEEDVNKKGNSNCDFAGFKTASNKDIKISDNALAKTKQIFDGIDIFKITSRSSEEDVKKKCDSDSDIAGFKTASNKDDKISDNALANTKQIFNVIDIFEIGSKSSEDHNDKLFQNKIDNIIEKCPNESYSSFQRHTKTDLIGFKTASNKHINISENALAKIKTVFHDINLPDLEVPDLDRSSKHKSLHNSASKSNAKKQNEPEDAESRFSVENIDKTKKLIEIANFTKPFEDRDCPSTSKGDFVGFRTANNNKIIISEAALSKTKNIFRDIDEENVAPSKDIIYPHLNKGRLNDISRHNTKVKKLNEVPEENETLLLENFDNARNRTEISSETHFMGFRTGNNNKITISESALAKTKKIFHDIDKQTSSDIVVRESTPIVKEQDRLEEKSIVKIIHDRKLREEFNNKFEPIQNKEPPFKRFKTGNYKPVNISKETLDRSTKIFENIDLPETFSKEIFVESQTDNKKPVSLEDQICSKNILGVDKESKNIKETGFTGFLTGNNEKVEISRKALAISKKILDDSDLNDGIQNKDIAFKGFQTANNKPVKISALALAKTKSIFQDIYTDEYTKEINNVALKGFQTANKNEVKIPTEDLADSRKIFNDFKSKDDANTFQINKEMVSFSGFQTANNKKVIISEDALEKSKKLLSEVNYNVIDNEDTEPKLSQVFGLKSVNKKNSKKSVDESKKSRKLFDDVDNCNVMNENNLNHTELNTNISHLEKQNLIHFHKKEDKNTSVNSIMEQLMNTQVINNFEETLNTEDFLATPKQKRSASPILSCPKAKKRKKFETPYTNQKVNAEIYIKPNQIEPTDLFDPDYKKNKRYNLKDIKLLNDNEKDRHIDKYIINFDYNNLINFEFIGERNDLTDSKLTIELFKDYFKKIVNKKLIPDNWLDIQLRLILWKLISYELKFPKVMSGVCTAKNVLKQLKYRYRRELYNAERPAIRKILERDDVASKLMVLCVVEIYCGDDNGVANTTELLLTDGWYCIRACIDKTLAKYVSEGRIVVGSKIVTQGAELLNCEEGIAPWENISSVRLKLFGNSTRRARWDARLGFLGPAAILSQLSSVKPDGGKVSKLKVLVTRVYPPLYVEKFEDGSTVTRSERLEHIHQMKYESDRQALMEKLCEEVEKELSDEESPDSDIDINRTCVDSGSQIAKLLKRSKEPSQFRANLTESQKRLLLDHTMKKRDKLLEGIQAKVLSKLDKCGLTDRNVVPLLKVRIAGVEEKNGHVKVVKAQLSIWRPNDALTELITEGAWIEILNVVPTAVRYSELQLSAGRQTIFKQSIFKETEKIKPYITSLQRNSYPIKDLTSHPMLMTDYNEIDTTGIVFQIDPSYREFKSNNQFQNVYLTDENKNIICINFWGGIKNFGFENLLDTGQVVACVNLQKRAGNTRRNIQHYRATEFTYFTKTPKSVAARENIVELSKKISTINKNRFIDDCVHLKNNLLKCNNENYSPYRFNNNNISRNKMFIESPLIPKINKLQEDFNLSGLDFESTFKHTDTQELSPNSVLRRKKVNEKIAKLKMYGEPPPLCPISIINKSKSAATSYKSPLIKDNSVASVQSDTPQIASMKNTPRNSNNLEINCSPVLSVSKKYGKSVNPVKLDFNSVANEENEEVDHFADEFDASPPLSLD